jgi:dUTP pyrophosphatase
MKKLRVYCKKDQAYPERAHPTDAGLDLKADKDYALIPGVPVKVHTGIHIEIPEGYAGFIYPRSGLATKEGIVLANIVGVIDSDYRGEIICAMIWNLNSTINPYVRKKIKKGQRIAQLVVSPVWTGELERVESLEDLSNTMRGEGGFGHTGS